MSVSSGSVNVSLQVNELATVGIGSVTNAISVAIGKTIAAGTGANQYDTVYSTSGSFGGTPITLNLVATLTNFQGASITFARFKGLLVANDSVTNGDIITLGAGSNAITSLLGATGTAVVQASGFAFFWAPLATGYVVTPTTAMNLKLDPGAGTFAYRVFLIGASV